MGERMTLTGNEAGAYAMKQINPDVVAAYPITPQTELMHDFAQFVADGEVDTDLITVESEHSAMSACVGASASGSRVMTATSANGFALMWEIVYIAASSRLPIVMGLVNRALSGPINIHCDHSDSMGGRDAGWIQLYAANSQEVYDLLIQGIRMGEHPLVQLPVMVCYDGFIISHTVEVLETLKNDEVKKFIGPFKPRINLLDIDNPFTFGPLDFHDFYIEHKRQQAEAMKEARKVIPDVFKEYKKLSGREYDFISGYKVDDAEVVMVALGSTADTAKLVVDEMREDGKKVGILKITSFRPFPYQELKEILLDKKAVVVMDRSDSFGAMGGPVYMEVRSALYGISDPPPITGLIYGLGGRNIRVDELKEAFNRAYNSIGEDIVIPVEYIGVRE
jgi:pyruvate ferredoxin oxidoreductase alpha subunit